MVAVSQPKSIRVPFRNVRRNGDGGPTHLSHEFVPFVGRKSPAKLISAENKIHGRLPRIKITKAENRCHRCLYFCAVLALQIWQFLRCVAANSRERKGRRISLARTLSEPDPGSRIPDPGIRKPDPGNLIPETGSRVPDPDDLPVSLWVSV
jgi:hypothetical protein